MIVFQTYKSAFFFGKVLGMTMILLDKKFPIDRHTVLWTQT